MSKKEPSPAQLAAREKFAQAAKDRAAKRKAEVNPTPAPPDNNDVAKLWEYIRELEKRSFFPQPAQATPVVSKQVVTKFSFKPQDYPDPRERLFTEKKLNLKGFNKDWWDLEWEVQRVNYEEDGQKYAAPRFVLRLVRIIEDKETGEPSKERYVLCQVNFFEDPDTFMWIANQNGIDVPEDLYKDFMDEMRYLVARDYLLDCFYPPKPAQDKLNKRETVIDNRLVEVFEVNSATEESVFERI